MRVTERYRRVDHDTILYDITSLIQRLTLSLLWGLIEL